jgi:DNA-3-methyladenine glycosylase II
VAWLVRFSEVTDRWDGQVYRRLLYVRGAPVLLGVSQQGPPSAASLSVELRGRRASGAPAVLAAKNLLERALGAGCDVRPFYRAVRSDPWIGSSVRTFRGLRVAGRPDLFEAIVTAVLSQQVNLRFAYSIRDEMVRSFGRRARIDGVSYHAFPTPKRVAAETVPSLRQLRLSRAKAETMLRLAERFASGDLSNEVFDGLPDEEAVERLLALKGVGRWTAETALLRGLGRLDAFPAADLGVVKSLAQGLLGRRSPASEGEMRRVAERWRPYRGLALVYAYAELARRS